MEIRDLDPDASERIREMVDSAMTTSYRLSPEQIDAITDVEFSDDALMEAVDDHDSVALVAANGSDDIDTAVAGIVIGGLTDDIGELRWLLVDPEHRGAGIGTKLFETGVEALRDRDVDSVRVRTLEKNTEGEQFVERFDFVRTAERTVEFTDQALVEYVYTEPSAASETTDAAETDAGTVEFPDTELQDGVRTSTDDGQRVYIDTDDPESGSEGPIFQTYTDSDLTEPYGYYCGNCGSLDVMMDEMTRMVCPKCGNSHASRSDGTYDDSHL
jgi:ribosomal protein S18 acetylase RimI-like enzyme/predicted RNA-binding Zn-ribbon protein involved in translation (DUF1610 family)